MNILQSQGVSRIGGDDDIRPDLSSVRQHRCEAGEAVVAKLQDVLASAARLKVGDDIFAETCPKNEGVITTLAKEHFVCRAACDRVIAGGTDHEVYRSWVDSGGWTNMPVAIEILIETGLERLQRRACS